MVEQILNQLNGRAGSIVMVVCAVIMVGAQAGEYAITTGSKSKQVQQNRVSVTELEEKFARLRNDVIDRLARIETKLDSIQEN